MHVIHEPTIILPPCIRLQVPQCGPHSRRSSTLLWWPTSMSTFRSSCNANIISPCLTHSRCIHKLFVQAFRHPSRHHDFFAIYSFSSLGILPTLRLSVFDWFCGQVQSSLLALPISHRSPESFLNPSRLFLVLEIRCPYHVAYMLCPGRSLVEPPL